MGRKENKQHLSQVKKQRWFDWPNHTSKVNGLNILKNAEIVKLKKSKSKTPQHIYYEEATLNVIANRLKVKTWEELYPYYNLKQTFPSRKHASTCSISHGKYCQWIPMLQFKKNLGNVLLKFITYIITIEGIIHCYKHPLVESYNVFFTEFSARKTSVFYVNSCAFLNQISITQAKVFLLCLG